jgi:hypothetical protein
MLRKMAGVAANPGIKYRVGFCGEGLMVAVSMGCLLLGFIGFKTNSIYINVLFW